MCVCVCMRARVRVYDALHTKSFQFPSAAHTSISSRSGGEHITVHTVVLDSDGKKKDEQKEIIQHSFDEVCDTMEPDA